MTSYSTYIHSPYVQIEFPDKTKAKIHGGHQM